MGRLDGKVAIVSGSAGGIGRATARKMAAEGALVLVADINGDGADETVAQIRSAGGEATPHVVDLASPDEVAAMIAAAVSTYGGLDVLHNNAAATNLVSNDRDLLSVTLELWEATIAVNLRSVLLASQHAIPLMLARGGGAIINTSSISAISGDLNYSAYGASKAGINALTLYIATQYGKRGIRCNAVLPGMVLTSVAHDIIESAALQEYTRQHVAPRLGRPEDIANMVAFLASDEAEWVTGQLIRVDGGLFSHNPTVAAFRHEG